MAIEINYSVQGLDPLTEAINSLIAKLGGLENNLNSVSSVNKEGSPETQNKVNATAVDAKGAFEDSSKITTSNQKLTEKIDMLISSLNNVNATMVKTKGRLTPEELKTNLDIQKQYKTDSLEEQLKLRQKYRREIQEERKTGKFTNALLFGGGLGLIYGANRVGGTLGSSAGVLNSGFQNYTNFAQQQYNLRSNLEQSGINATVGTATGAAFLSKLPLGAKIGIGAIAAGVEGITNYRTVSNQELNTKATNADLLSWQLQNSGLSSASNASARSGGGLTYSGNNIRLSNLQNQSLTPNNVFYDTTLKDTILNAKRDTINNLGINDKIEYNKQINLLSKLSNNPNVGQLSTNASILSSATGQSPLEAIRSMTNDYVRYGGDTAGNTAKIVDLLQSTPMGYGQANSLVNRYQYDQPMLQNKIANSTATPFSLFNKSLLMKLAGATPQEIASGMPSGSHMAMIARGQQQGRSLNLGKDAILGQMMMMGVSATGENVFANSRGAVTPTMNQVGNESMTATMQASAQEANKWLKDLKVDNQNVTATTVNVYGNVSSSGQQYPAANITSHHGMASAGVTQGRIISTTR